VGGVSLLLAKYVLGRVSSVNIGFGLFFSAVIGNDWIGTPQHCDVEMWVSLWHQLVRVHDIV